MKRKKNGSDEFYTLPANRTLKSTYFRCGKHQDTTVLQDEHGYYCPKCKSTPRQVIDNLGNLV